MSRVRRVIREGGPVLTAIAAVLIVWILVYLTGIFGHRFLPSPLSVWTSLRNHIADGSIPTAALKTLIRLTFSFVVAIVFGTAIGFGLVASNFARRGIGKLIVGLQVIPSPAWIPLAVVWFHATERAVVFVAIVGSFPSITLATVSSLRQAPPILQQAGRTLGAKGWRLYSSIVFPAALPGYVAGLQQAWGFAWRALMAGELIVQAARASGLGQMLARASERPVDTPLLLAVLAVVILIGVAVDLLVFGAVDRRIRRRRGLAPSA